MRDEPGKNARQEELKSCARSTGPRTAKSPGGRWYYNGHYGIRELCGICPLQQIGRCSTAWKAPEPQAVTADARNLGAVGPVEITDRAVLVSGLAEHPRYYLQHGYGFQVHDRAHPHRERRHGRAEIGWQTEPEAP